VRVSCPSSRRPYILPHLKSLSSLTTSTKYVISKSLPKLVPPSQLSLLETPSFMPTGNPKFCQSGNPKFPTGNYNHLQPVQPSTPSHFLPKVVCDQSVCYNGKMSLPQLCLQCPSCHCHCDVVVPIVMITLVCCCCCCLNYCNLPLHFKICLSVELL
jgi:hypothetical protein